MDFDRYPNAAKMCRNFLLLPQGGITRRPGTRFVKEVKDSSADTILFPFEFSQEQAYIVEMGNAYARFYRRQARIEVDDISASITNGLFGSNINSWSDLHTSSYVGGTTSTADASSYTFSAQSIGAAASDRNLVIAIAAGDDAGAAFTITGVTVDGVSATIIQQASASSTDQATVGIAALPWSSGTAATIVVTLSATVSNCRIDVYRVFGNVTASYATATDNTIAADVLSTTIDVPVAGTLIAVAAANDANAAPTGITWVGVTEDSDITPEGEHRFGCGHIDIAAGAAGRTVSATFGTDADQAGALVAVSFGADARISYDSTNGRLQFDEATAGVATATQAVTITETSTEHVLKFTIGGYGGGSVNFRVGTTPAGNDLVDIDCLVGDHSIGFTPGAATVYVQFHSQNAPIRTMYLDNVAFIDNAAMEVVSPYASADLTDLRVYQAADVMFLLHPDYAPRRLERRGHKSWSIVEAFFEDGPYNEINPDIDLTAKQLVLNPFFENGQQNWTPNTVNNGNVTAEPGENRIVLTNPADTDDSFIRQQVTGEANVEHVFHFMVNGVRTDTEFITSTLGSSAGGTQYYNNTNVAPRWTSAAFTPTGTAIHIQIGTGDNETSPLYVHAALIYPASARLMRVAATSGSTTLTAVGHSPFVSTDVGRLVRLQWPGYEPGYGVITAFTSSSVVTLLVLRAMAYASVCTEKWQLGAWSDTDGWPRVVGFFEGRLVAANTDTAPQSLWLSQSDDLQNMRPDSWVEGVQTIEDDDAIAVTLNSRRIDPVVWLSEQRDLVIGTVGSQWVISSSGPVLTPSDVSAKAHSATPAADIQAAQSNQIALFLDRSKRELYEIGFSFDDQSYVVTLLTILADHIFRSPAHQILQYQRLPHSILWTPREDGRCATLSYNRQHDILGWSQQIFGGAFSSADAVVEHLAVIHGASDANQVNDSDDRDEVWLIVKRTINGSTKRYIEVLEGVFEGPLREDYDTEEDWRDAVVSAMPDAFYVDCGITYDGVSASTITGLSHLEGQTVKVLANGRVHPDCTVSSGQISLNYNVTKAQIGLSYLSRYESLKLAVGATAGTAINKIKAITGVSAVVLDSGAFKVTGVDYDDFAGRRQHDLQVMPKRPDETRASNVPMPLVSGEVNVSTETHYPPDARIYVETDLPLPVTILAFAPEIRATDARAST